MKLELKHVLAYIAYDIYVLDNFNKKCRVVLDLEDEKSDRQIRISYVLNKQYKPILCPLSYLTKEEIRNEFIELGLHKVFNFRNIWIIIEHKQYSLLPQSLYEYLLSKHYDLKGLIDEGLAIDINTLNQ